MGMAYTGRNTPLKKICLVNCVLVAVRMVHSRALTYSQSFVKVPKRVCTVDVVNHQSQREHNRIKKEDDGGVNQAEEEEGRSIRLEANPKVSRENQTHGNHECDGNANHDALHVM